MRVERSADPTYISTDFRNVLDAVAERTAVPCRRKATSGQRQFRHMYCSARLQLLGTAPVVTFTVAKALRHANTTLAQKISI